MLSSSFIPFNKPYINSKALEYLTEAISSGELQGDGSFTKKCEIEINKISGTNNSFLTPSCTDAIEMAYRLIGISPGNEVIMPSFNFTSAAIAAVKLGATPVFVDIDLETLNISQKEVLNSVSEKTKAICFLNYAGYGVDLDLIKSHINRQDIYLIEDNAHGFGGKYKKSNLGNLGDISVQSFHSTTNIQCGEGGALVVNNSKFIERAEIIREKGTDRSKFVRGEVQKYQWVDNGSSYLLSEVQAAILLGPLEKFTWIQLQRNLIWQLYTSVFMEVKNSNFNLMPIIEAQVAHMYYLEFQNSEKATEAKRSLLKNGIEANFHYQDLSKSKAGKTYSKKINENSNSLKTSNTLLRLPIWIGIDGQAISNILTQPEVI